MKMADDKESKDALDTVAEAAAPRKVKAPPKGSTPEAKDGGDSKTDDGGEKKKKKALPPPGNPPPQSATSAVAAVRAKSSLPPPNGPPPTSAAPSASVAKIRGAARPPSGSPPGAKPTGAPPSGAPPQKAPPPKSDAKTTGDVEGDAKEVATPRALDRPEPKKVMRPPTARSNSEPPAESKQPSRSAVAPMAKATPTISKPPVDVLSENDAVASAPVSSMKGKSPPKIKLSSATSQPTMMMRPTTASTPTMLSGFSSPPSTAPPSKPVAAKRSTLDVLNDTSAAINRGTRNAPSASTLDDPDRPSTPAAASAAGRGRAVPLSGSSRPNVPEDDIVLVKKEEYKQEAEVKSGKAIDLEDSTDDIEEIPFLDEAKTEPKDPSDKIEVRRLALHSHDEDPEIIMETKPTANTSKSKSIAEAKSKQPTSSDHKPSNNDEKIDDAALLEKATPKDALSDDIYNELRKLKRTNLTNDDSRSAQPTDNSPRDTECKHQRQSTDDHEPNDAKDEDNGSPRTPSHGSSSRDKHERRREKRRHKHDDEPKKIQAQFFNPKNVPFMPDQLLDFVKRPLECGRGNIIKCFIERNDQNKLAPVFTLLLEVNSVSGRPIMYAKKKGASRITSHYVISLNKEDLNLPRMMRSHQYIGKLRSSTSMMEYCLYDQGDNPEDLDSDCEIDDELRKSIRAELAVARFHNTKKPYARKMEVVIPTIVENGTAYLDWRPISRDQMMEEHMRAITIAGGQNVLDTQNFTFMHKRETKYDPLSSCIVDFRSRATCTSVKNFQLVHSEPTNEEMRERYRKLHPDYVFEDQGTVSLPQEHVLLQLGKVGKHCFNMDFQYPLSMLQAFAICLARFDSKQR